MRSAQLGAGSDRRGEKPCTARERKELKVRKGSFWGPHARHVGRACGVQVVSQCRAVVCAVIVGARCSPRASGRAPSRRERIVLVPYAPGYRGTAIATPSRAVNTVKLSQLSERSPRTRIVSYNDTDRASIAAVPVHSSGLQRTGPWDRPYSVQCAQIRSRR